MTDARATLNKAITEEELLLAVTEWLTITGWTWTHSRRSDKALTMGHQGVPDIIAARKGRVVFLELKTENGQLTESQFAWSLAVQNRNEHQWRVIRPSNLDDTLRWLA